MPASRRVLLIGLTCLVAGAWFALPSLHIAAEPAEPPLAPVRAHAVDAPPSQHHASSAATAAGQLGDVPANAGPTAPAATAATPASGAAASDVIVPAGKCRTLYRAMGPRAFVLYRITGPVHSVEKKIVSAMLPAMLAACKRATDVATDATDGVRNASQLVVVDVGANDGEDVPFWFESLGPQSPCGRKTAFFLFEPQQRYVPALQQVIANASGVQATLVNAGVGPDKKHGAVIVMVGEGQQGIANLDEKKGVKLSQKNAAKNKKSAITLASLPRTLADAGHGTSDVLMLKIDCEGADATILTSVEPLFASHRVYFVVFELNKMVKHFSTKYPTAVAMLRRHRYRCFMMGLNHKSKELVVFEMDESQVGAWAPNLETMFCIGPKFTSLIGSGTDDAFFSALGGSRLSPDDTAAYLSSIRAGAAKSTVQACAPHVHTLRCPLCGGESRG